MGRHSSGEERVFWRSVALFVLKWSIVAALPALAIWGVFRLINQPESIKTRKPAVVATSPSPTPEPPQEPSPAPPASPSPVASPSPAASKGTLQVLNGSDTPGLATKAAQRLRNEGYEVVAVANASGDYQKTTVFYQSGHKPLADQVAKFIGATEVKPAPNNLDRSIPVTVVIGNDYKA